MVVGAIRGLAARDVDVVALDGSSGSGKSTLARRLVERLGGVVVEGDDFYRVMDDSVDMAVLVDASQHARDERVANRDHDNVRWHSRWAAAEKYYFANVPPRESLDLIVEGD